ncbi:undecaprenyl-phosphate glucose phosphotransferase [Polaribacter tangerinus]|uniref:undecaprenyl-phosphate glucose phosphotransferase n=1 Tax=Polaribacter tangerinus TaxID=1920034 RepID=UPI000B4AFA4F|nr:undecaprenyl-phosphate glucose phosphotransferase [Polaribacter tangerinus]
MKKRYSYLIKPLQILIDVLTICCIIYIVNDSQFFNEHFIAFIIIFWLISSLLTGFYKVYRFTKKLRILSLLVKQLLIFTLGFFAYFGLFKEGEVVNNQFLILLLITISITTIKYLAFFVLNKYRALGNNYRNVVVVGLDGSTKNIIKLFTSKANLGYNFLGYFSDTNTHSGKDFLGTTNSVFKFINENDIDEVYCSLTLLKEEQIKTINKFCLEKKIGLKLIPNSVELYSKNQRTEFYDDDLIVLNVQKLPFDFAGNFYLKRTFDVFFSLFICFTLLSWLWPILWVIVKFESKGPLLFKQKREGINGNKFTCYKFRSMKINNFSDKVHTTKNDNRVTKIGSFLRKTSIDELPQFINVLLGNMSVVGPRPHLESLSIEYQKQVDDYLKRHIVKPGITGLAQVSGYRGEIKKKSDIKNRVRLDIFYIENWSFFLDIKIILKTVINILKGEEKAY